MLPSGTAPHHLANFLPAFIHPVDCDVMGKAADPSGQLDLLASSRARDPSAIPAFVHLRERVADRLAHAQACGQACAGVTVGRSHPHDEIASTSDKAADRACPTGEAAPFSQLREGSPDDVGRLARVETGKGVSEIPVVARRERLLVGIRRAADGAQQTEVVDVGQFIPDKTEVPAYGKGKHAVAKTFLHGEAVGQVGGEGQCGEQLDKPDAACRRYLTGRSEPITHPAIVRRQPDDAD